MRIYQARNLGNDKVFRLVERAMQCRIGCYHLGTRIYSVGKRLKAEADYRQYQYANDSKRNDPAHTSELKALIL